MIIEGWTRQETFRLYGLLQQRKLKVDRLLHFAREKAHAESIEHFGRESEQLAEAMKRIEVASRAA